MEHLKLFHQRLNIPKVIRAVQVNRQWSELTFLYVHYDEHDNAALTMINHSEDAWEHSLFKDVIIKVSNLDLYFKAVQFYLEEQPLLVNDLLAALTPRVDHARTVALVRRLGHLPLVKPYLVSAQHNNIVAVNEALNELLIEEENYEALRVSIDGFDNFDAIALAQKVEKHELLEFRRIAAYLYKKNKRWAQSVELSKKDKLYKDALETAAESRDQAVSEDLLKFFVEIGNHSAFAATLYTCYDLIRPDVALELSWKNKIIDFAFPYIIQYVRDINTRVETLEKGGGKRDEVLDKKKEKAPEGFQVPPDPQLGTGIGLDGMGGGYYQPYGYGAPGGAPPALAIMPPPGSMPGFGAPAYPVDYNNVGYAQQPPYDAAPFGYGGFQ